MKNIYAILLIVLFTFGTNAQECTIEWGKDIISNINSSQEILGEYHNELYQLKKTGPKETPFIEILDSKDLHLISSNKIVIPDFGDKNSTYLSDLFLIKGNLILLFSQSTTKTNAYTRTSESKYKCYATILEKNGKFRGDPLLIQDDIQNTISSPVKGCRGVVSKDTNTLFIYSSNIIQEKFTGKIVDKDLNILSSHELNLPFERSYSLGNFILDKNKVLYCTTKEELLESEWYSKKVKKYTYKVMLFDLNNNTSKSKLIPIKIDMPLTNFNLELQDDGLYLSSYYYSGTKHKTIGGGVLFYQFKTNTLELINSSENEFENIILSQLNSNVQLPNFNSFDETTNAINSLKNTKVMFLENGDKLITSEQVVYLEGSTTLGDDNFNILISRINKNGKLTQNVVVPKIQTGLSKYIYSFAQFYKNNTLFILFYDNPKNLNLTDAYDLKGGIASIKGTVAVIVSVPEKGDWTKKILFETDKTSMDIRFNGFQYKKKNQIVFYGQKEKDVKFVKINY